MFNVAIVLFAVAAIAGLSMTIMHFQGRTPPRPALAIFHGLFAAMALVVLVLAVIAAHATGAPAIALAILVLAALGGFGLLSFHVRGRALQSGLVVGHGLLAVAGFVVLLLTFFLMRP